MTTHRIFEQEGGAPKSRSVEESRCLSYQFRTYMNHLSDEALGERAIHLFLNWCLDPPVERLVNAPPTGWEWLWRDVVDEAHRRFGEAVGAAFLERIREECETRWQQRPAISRESLADLLHRAPTQWDLIRYDKRRYLEPFLSRGEVRISPASKVNDPSLSVAIRDDELRLPLRPNPAEITLEAFDRNTGLSKGVIPRSDDELTVVSQTDYYFYCMSSFLSPILSYDFGADACLVIKGITVFGSRLRAGLNSKLPYPAWNGTIRPVDYVDPLNATATQVRVLFSKHFSYAYQQEWRLVWCPASPALGLDYLCLELGSMEDCCELLLL